MHGFSPILILVNGRFFGSFETKRRAPRKSKPPSLSESVLFDGIGGDGGVSGSDGVGLGSNLMSVIGHAS